MAYFELLLLLIFTISSSRCHAFDVSIHTFNHLPVIGANFTLVCTFTPQTWSRRVIWVKSNSLELATHSCTYSYQPCESIIPDKSKFALLGDNDSVNLTIYDISMDDSDTYKCIVGSSRWSEHTGSSIMEVYPLVPAPPQWLVIHDDRSTGYFSNARVTVTAGEQHDITCESVGARPPVVLAWELPDDMTVVVGRQSDVVRDDSYISRKVATIIPYRNDQGKSLRCVASHPELVHNQHRSIYLNVEVLPSSMLLSLSDQTSSGSLSTIFYVYENSLTSFTCRSIGSRPAAELSWALGYNDLISGNTSISVPNTLDRNLFDSESTITILIEKKHHMSRLYCFASSPIFFAMRTALLMVFGPPDHVTIVTPDDLQDGIQTNVRCRAHNGYPAPLIHWYIGTMNVTENSSRMVSRNVGIRYDVESTLMFTPQRSDHGKRLLCQALQPTAPTLQSMNASMVLNISFYALKPYVKIKPCEHSAVVNQSEDLGETQCTKFYALDNQTSFQLNCSVEGAKPNVSITWMSNKTNVGSNYALMSMFEEHEDGTFDKTLTMVGRVNETINGTVFTCVAEGSAVDGVSNSSVTFFKAKLDHDQPDIPGSSSLYIVRQARISSQRPSVHVTYSSAPAASDTTQPSSGQRPCLWGGYFFKTQRT